MYSLVTSEFGESRAGGRVHTGIDIAAPMDTAVWAAANGNVGFAGVQRGFGNIVVLFHTDGVETAYAHLNSIVVKMGQRVLQGQLIGRVGRSGNATGSHLHYEVRENGHCVNPRPFLP